MLDTTRKPLFPQVGTKKTFFENFGFRSLGKCRIVPKNGKGGPLGFNNIHCVAKYQKTRRGTLLRLKKNRKKSNSAEKNLGRTVRLFSKIFVSKGSPFEFFDILQLNVC